MEFDFLDKRPIRDVTPEVPESLATLIDRLLEKDPDRRIQSATEVADLLRKQLANLQDSNASPKTKTAVPAEHKTNLSRRQRTWLMAGSVLLVLAASLGVTEATGVTSLSATVVRVVTGEGTLVVEVDDPAVKVTVEGDGGLVITGAGAQEVRLRPGSYQVHAEKHGRPLTLERELVSISRGGRQVIRVHLETAPEQIPSKRASARGTVEQSALQALDGTWQIVSFQGEGREVLRRPDITWTFRGDRLEARVDGKYYHSATVKLIDTNAVPHKADLVDMKGTDIRQSCSAIYQILDDTLYWCHSYDGAPRPTEFRAAAGSGNNYSVLKRVVPPKTGQSLKGEKNAFVILGGKGVLERMFDTFAEAVSRSSDGDTIEIRGNGPFVIDPVRIEHALVIRAGDGHWPVIEINSESPITNTPPLVATAPLVLEGLEFRCPAFEQNANTVVRAQDATLHVANCHFVVTKLPICLLTKNSPICVARNCEFIGHVIGWAGDAGRASMENCVIAGSRLFGANYPNAEPQIAVVDFTKNTVVGYSAVGAGFSEAPREGKVTAIGLIFDSRLRRTFLTRT